MFLCFSFCQIVRERRPTVTLTLTLTLLPTLTSTLPQARAPIRARLRRAFWKN